MERMGELVVMVLEDEPEVRDAVVRDLTSFLRTVRVDEADTVDDAETVLAEAAEAGDHVGLVLADHRLPGRDGVDFLVQLHDDPSTAPIRKVLLTGQADHQDTIRAINDAGLDWYVAKPWDPDELRAVVVRQLTDFLVDADLDPLPYAGELDTARLMEAYARRGPTE